MSFKFNRNKSEYSEVQRVNSFESAVLEVQKRVEQEHNLDVFSLVDLDKTLNDPKYNNLVTLPGISFLTWHLLNPSQTLFPQEKMLALKNLCEISNVAVATNRREDSSAFQSDFLMEAFKNTLSNYEIEIPIFTRLSKQLQEYLPTIRKYSFNKLDEYLPVDDTEINMWIFGERDPQRELLVVCISDVDFTNWSNKGFLDTIVKNSGEKNAKGLRLDIK